MLAYLLKKERSQAELISAFAFVAFAFFMLPTEMHERYIFPAIAFLLPVAVERVNFRWVYLTLSLTAFFDLLLVLARTYPENFPLTARFWQTVPIDLLAAAVNVALLVYFLKMILPQIKRRMLEIIVFLALALGLVGYFMPRGELYLSMRQPKSAYQQWGTLKMDRTVDGHSLSVGGFIFDRGLGTHANSSIVYQLDGKYRRLEGAVGLDDEANRGNKLEFLIYADGRLIWRSGIFSGWRNPLYFKLDISEVKELNLMVGDGGDGINSDHADWLGIKVTP